MKEEHTHFQFTEPNALEKIAKLSKKTAKPPEMVAASPIDYFFSLEISRSQLFYLSSCIFPESVYGVNILQTFVNDQFQYFAIIFTRSV